MHWLDELSEPAELRLCIKNLVALSALPSLWTRLTTLEMCESVSGALLSMCDAEIVYLRLTEPGGQVIAEAAQTRLGPATGIIPALGRSLGPWIGARGKDSGTIANPFGSGKLTVAASRIGSGQGAIIACAETAGCPRPAQRLLLEVAADEIVTAMLQREAEDAEIRFRATAEHSSEFIGIADIEGNIGYINPAGRSLVGAGQGDDLSGTSMLDYVANGDRELLSNQILPRTLRAGRWSGELALHHRVTGMDIPVTAEVFTVEHPRTGAPMNIATVSREISQAELSVRQMRLRNEELAARVARQTAELAGLSDRLRAEKTGREGSETQLREVHLELFQAMRLGAAGQMAASLAHALSQPLTAASNSLGVSHRIVEAAGGSGESLEAIAAAAEQIDRASAIIHGLRAFISRGRSKRQPEDLATILEEAVAFAMIDANALGVSLLVHQDPGVSQVHVDRLQIQQVVVNLVRNAVEAMAQSERRELSIEVIRGPDGMIEVAVIDSGPGLPKEVADRLFSPFVTTKGNGLGLGLAVSKAIVQANGGDLTVGPRMGGGTVFRFTLAPVPAEPSN